MPDWARDGTLPCLHAVSDDRLASLVYRDGPLSSRFFESAAGERRGSALQTRLACYIRGLE